MANDLFNRRAVPLDAQIHCVGQEITRRENVYYQSVRNRRMSRAAADREIGLMKAVRETLRELRDAELKGR